MALRNFIKENFVLLLGLALPVLLIAFFMLASLLPKAVGVPPAYDVVFIAPDYNKSAATGFFTDFTVRDGRLHLRLTPRHDAGGYGYTQRLFLYNPAKNDLREIAYDIPADTPADKVTDIIPEEAKDLVLDTAAEAPDGYRFETGYYHSGLVMDIFGIYGGDRGGPRLVRKSSVFRVDPPQKNYPGAYALQFVGWIVKPEGKTP